MSRFHIRLRRRNIPSPEILDDMRRVARELQGSSLSRLEYDERGKFGATTARNRFGSWNHALLEAGLSISMWRDISNEELFKNIATVWTSLGYQPLGRHMSKKETGSLYSTTTYKTRFGSWNRALLAFVEYVDGAGGNAYPPTAIPEAAMSTVSIRRRTRRDVNWRLRAKILIRDNCICRMCGVSPAKNPETVMHVDHIVAWANGGETVEENLQTLCERCNIGKSNVM